MFVILEPFEERAGKPELERHRGRRPSCASSSAKIQEAQVGRLRRAAGRRPGQHRRLQAAGAGPRGAGPAGPARARSHNLAEQGNARPAAGRPVQQLQRQPAAALRRHRPRQGQGAGRRRSTTSIDTLQAYLGSAYVNDFTFRTATGRSTSRPTPRYRLQRRGHRPAARSATPTATWCRWSTLITVRDDSRPGHRQPLQPVSLGRDQRQHRAGRQLRPGHRHHGRSSPSRSCPSAMGYRVDRTDATSRSRPARTC